jgi:signal peptidase II
LSANESNQPAGVKGEQTARGDVPAVAGAAVAGRGGQELWPRAIFSWRANLRFWLVAILGLALDLGSKQWAFGTLRQTGRRVLIPHVLELQTMMNDGALFGIGGGRTGLFLLASALALVLVLWMFTQTSARSWLVHIALGAVLAGALGNMYDRAFVRLVKLAEPGASPRYYQRFPGPSRDAVTFREYPARPDDPGRVVSSALAAQFDEAGFVRDFIKIPTKLYGKQDLWPWVFNVADSLLVGGVAILALRLWRERETKRGGEKRRQRGEKLDPQPQKA